MRTDIIFILTILVVTTSCGQKQETFTFGQISNSVYTNDFFKIKIQIPKDTYVMDKDGLSNLVDQNLKLHGDIDDEQAKRLDEQKEFTKMIFALFKYKPDTIIEVNPNITITTTKVKHFPKLKNIDYAIQVGRQGLIDINPKFNLDNNLYSIKIGTKEFKGYHATYSDNGLSAQYEMLLANFNDYNLNLTYSYKDKNDKDFLMTIIEKIEIR